jgi:hypothetical protein
MAFEYQTYLVKRLAGRLPLLDAPDERRRTLAHIDLLQQVIATGSRQCQQCLQDCLHCRTATR